MWKSMDLTSSELIEIKQLVIKLVAEGVCGLLEKPGAQIHQSTGVSYLRTLSSYT